MIAIDSNVVLRYILEDDEEQTEQAERLIEGGEKVLVTDAVLVETLWTLRGHKYSFNKQEISETVLSLFKQPNLQFEDGQVVWKALNDYRKSKIVKGKGADFPDALIVNKARFVMENKGEVFKGSYTFDKAAQQLPGAKKPE